MTQSVKLSEKDVRRLAKDTQHKKIPHSIVGVSVFYRTVTRADDGSFVLRDVKTAN